MGVRLETVVVVQGRVVMMMRLAAMAVECFVEKGEYSMEEGWN